MSSFNLVGVEGISLEIYMKKKSSNLKTTVTMRKSKFLLRMMKMKY